MAVTLTGGEQQQRGGTFMGYEAMTQSTATTPQALSVTRSISILGMGTATGSALRNKYTLATSGLVEGMEKWIRSEATGEASVIVGGGHSGRLPFDVAFNALGTGTSVDATGAVTATGHWVFTATGQTLGLKVIDGVWRYFYAGPALGPTIATTT